MGVGPSCSSLVQLQFCLVCRLSILCVLQPSRNNSMNGQVQNLDVVDTGKRLATKAIHQLGETSLSEGCIR